MAPLALLVAIFTQQEQNEVKVDLKQATLLRQWHKIPTSLLAISHWPEPVHTATCSLKIDWEI